MLCVWNGQKNENSTISILKGWNIKDCGVVSDRFFTVDILCYMLTLLFILKSIIFWDVRTGNKKRPFAPGESAQWPVFK